MAVGQGLRAKACLAISAGVKGGWPRPASRPEYGVILIVRDAAEKVGWVCSGTSTVHVTSVLPVWISSLLCPLFFAALLCSLFFAVVALGYNIEMSPSLAQRSLGRSLACWMS